MMWCECALDVEAQEGILLVL